MLRPNNFFSATTKKIRKHRSQFSKLDLFFPILTAIDFNTHIINYIKMVSAPHFHHLVIILKGTTTFFLPLYGKFSVHRYLVLMVLNISDLFRCQKSCCPVISYVFHYFIVNPSLNFTG